MRLKAKRMQNAVLSKAAELHPFFSRRSPITWDLLKPAFLEATVLVQACGHPETGSLHPLVFASSGPHPRGYNHGLFFPFGIVHWLVPATASSATSLCLAGEPFTAGHPWRCALPMAKELFPVKDLHCQILVPAHPFHCLSH